MSTDNERADPQRERFEAWALSLGRPAWMLQKAIGDLRSGEYADSRTEYEWQVWQAWQAWQACEARAATSPSIDTQEPEGEVVITTTDDGRCGAVTRQDEEGRILSVLWEAPQERAQPGDPVSVAVATLQSAGWVLVGPTGAREHGVEAEPVAWVHEYAPGFRRVDWLPNTDMLPAGTKLYAYPPASDRSADWIAGRDAAANLVETFPFGQKARSMADAVRALTPPDTFSKG